MVRAGSTGPSLTIEECEDTHPRHGDRPNDWSPSSNGPGPRAFGRRILKASFPQRFLPPTNIARYTKETNPGIWLEDFWLAYRARGVDDDYFIIQYLLIYMGEHVRAWLKFLSPNSIRH